MLNNYINEGIFKHIIIRNKITVNTRKCEFLYSVVQKSEPDESRNKRGSITHLPRDKHKANSF